MDEGGGGIGNLASMLRPLLEKMMNEILMEILGGKALQGIVAGMLTGEQPATSLRHRGWNLLRAMRCQRSSGARDGESAEAKELAMILRGRALTKGLMMMWGHPKATQRASKGGGEAGSRSKGQGQQSDKHKAKGKNKGKGSGSAPPEAADDGGGWTTVNRRPVGEWSLRAVDWSDPDPVLDYETLIANASGDDEVVRAAAIADEEQRETLLSLFRGSGTAHALLMVTTAQSTGTERWFGEIGGKLVFRQVVLTRACLPGLQPPQPKVQALGGKVEVLKSSVIFVKFMQLFCDKEQWSQFVKQLQRALLDNRSTASAVLLTIDIPTVLATSGRPAFFEPSRSYDLAATIEWQQQHEAESPGPT